MVNENADYESDADVETHVHDENETVTEAAENAAKSNEEKMEAGMEKISKTVSDFQAFSNDTIKAYVESAAIAGKALESLNREFYAYFQKSLEDSMAATKAIYASKSVHEAFAHQTDFTKAALDAHKEQMEKIHDGLTAARKDSLAPIKSRAHAVAEAIENAHAA